MYGHQSFDLENEQDFEEVDHGHFGQTVFAIASSADPEGFHCSFLKK